MPGTFDLTDYLSVINFQFKANNNQTGVLTIEVSLDKGQTYSKLENNAHTTLSVTSLIVIEDNTNIIISPKLIDKFSLTHPI